MSFPSKCDMSYYSISVANASIPFNFEISALNFSHVFQSAGKDGCFPALVPWLIPRLFSSTAISTPDDACLWPLPEHKWQPCHGSQGRLVQWEITRVLSNALMLSRTLHTRAGSLFLHVSQSLLLTSSPSASKIETSGFNVRVSVSKRLWRKPPRRVYWNIIWPAN